MMYSPGLFSDPKHFQSPEYHQWSSCASQLTTGRLEASSKVQVLRQSDVKLYCPVPIRLLHGAS